jgi:hypothetical protein
MESINSTQKTKSIPRLKNLESTCQAIINASEDGRFDKITTQIKQLSNWIRQLDWEDIISDDQVGNDMFTVVYTIILANRNLISKGLPCDSLNDAFPSAMLPETDFSERT